VNGSAAEDDWLAGASVAVVRYPAMLAGTVAGQLLGIAVDAAIGSRTVWFPLACSVALEALAGTRAAASRGEGPLDAAQSARVSVTYSLGLLLVSVPLVIWIAASHTPAPDAGGALALWTPGRLGLAAVALAIATVVRWRLMIVLAPRRRG
jgi:hypothetical protein